MKSESKNRKQTCEPQDPDVVLSVRDVSKKFCRNLRRSMLYGMQDLGRSLFGARPADHGLRQDEFWALSDISFELKRGEVIGLVGENGSGKTTLLRLLTGIFPPDRGSICLRGRLGALIALGAGFHPHMTGRENIELNGSILGIWQETIRRRFDEIVDFAELSDFLDAPVSNYSSGMRVRLGFAIAVCMEPDILLVDEVLSVGDTRFQRKCINRMRDLMKSGVGVIFVSHNLPQVGGLCHRGILIEHGHMACTGPIQDVIQKYLLSTAATTDVAKGLAEANRSWRNLSAPQSGEVSLESAQMCHSDGTPGSTFTYDEAVRIVVNYRAVQRLKSPLFGFTLVREDEVICCAGRTSYSDVMVEEIEGRGSFEVRLDPIQLHTGRYRLCVVIFDEFINLPYAYAPELAKFEVRSPWLEGASTSPIFLPNVEWSLNGKKLETTGCETAP